MTLTTIHDLAEWRSRLARALQASLAAMDARLPSAEIASREAAIGALEQEGAARDFVPVKGRRR